MILPRLAALCLCTLALSPFQYLPHRGSQSLCRQSAPSGLQQVANSPVHRHTVQEKAPALRRGRATLQRRLHMVQHLPCPDRRWGVGHANRAGQEEIPSIQGHRLRLDRGRCHHHISGNARLCLCHSWGPHCICGILVSEPVAHGRPERGHLCADHRHQAAETAGPPGHGDFGRLLRQEGGERGRGLGG